jgi:tRNA dimethylallyltransferase
MQPIITILGPTAIGKSSLAVNLAKEFNGAIISADSRQIYKNFDIGSGKINFNEMQGIEHYMLNIKDLWQDYNLAEFQKDTYLVLKKLKNTNTLPFLVGGTGLYIESIIYNYNLSNIDIDKDLRVELSKLDKFNLQKKLLLLNPKINLNESDWNNPIRLIRAIETTKNKNNIKPNNISREFKPLIIGLSASLEKIKSKIISRVDARLQAGAILEVKNIQKILNHKIGSDLAAQKLAQFGLGTIAISQYLDGQTTYEEMRTKYIQSEYQYARRQLTWFRRMSQINWFEADDKDLLTKTSKLITSFLK